VVREWQQTNQRFLKEQSPRMVYWLLDSRRDQPKIADKKFGKFLVANRIPFTIVYTKVDKKRTSLQLLDAEIQKLLKAEKRNLIHSPIIDRKYLKELDMVETSAKQNINVGALRFHILESVEIIQLDESGEYSMIKPAKLDELPDSAIRPEVEKRVTEEKQKAATEDLLDQDEGEESIEEKPKKQPVYPRKPQQKKRKAKLRIGELVKTAPKAHKDIQRTRHLSDDVNRTEKQYKSYQRIHKYRATKHLHGKSKSF
jgi:hypothetical protein